MEHQTGCLICGEELVYSAQSREQSCFYCGQKFDVNVKCVQGHYVCDQCHAMSANELIEQTCQETQLTDPLNLAVALMKHPNVKMHGPEHHFLVPAVLLTAFYNQQGQPEMKAEKLRLARERAQVVKGGFCGYWGSCGAGIGNGIFMSLVTGATPVSRQEWRVSNLLTAASLCCIAEHGGPRCCKRNTFLAIITAVEFLKQELEIELEMRPDIECEFSHLNRECLQGRCPFYSS
ncbi:MAG: SAM-dependent methyltransferase [Anaerolineae bacterium]|nr:SAM-dependent methyltransferase [Anaerolineae bacterium]